MGKLVYSVATSLDGYVNDAAGGFGWAEPDEEVHQFFNDLERPVGTYLYGRAMYDTMKYWGSADDAADAESAAMRDFRQLWQAAGKIVYSRTLEAASTPRTRIEPEFVAATVRAMVDDAKRNVSIGGPTLAAAALRAGIVDEVNQVLNPVIVGGGTPFLPEGLFQRLQLLDERRFASGSVHLHYRVI